MVSVSKDPLDYMYINCKTTKLILKWLKGSCIKMLGLFSFVFGGEISLLDD